MTENTEKQATDEAWRQVGQQFQALGESLAETFRTAWESEETRRHVQNMQDGLEAMVSRVDQALKEAIASPKGKKLRTEAEKTAESLQAAGEQVGVRRLAERAAELAAEVGARQARGSGQVVHVQRLEVAGVGQVLGAQQVAGGREEGHERPIIDDFSHVARS